MNKIKLRQSVRAAAYAVASTFMLSPSLSSAAIDEFNGPGAEQLQTTEVKNEMVLLQRLDERTLLTDSGAVTLPYSVQLTDTRNPDDWYKREKAKVVFYFTKNLEMVRVVISE
ncbi:hypothetical protein [Ketobacter sp.]|uniref:hypothetical protein n=1 Tax=Ketobacter sp. TaxID=2083498 RepID=UPI000F1954ED|nr:hypothetical protein [Ketobacter sp.]RLU00874.1 MAG: hypothetical protein D9N14_04715 [Ketobacter sp.]